MYLLDTCTVSDFIKGDTNTLLKIKATNPSDLFLSSIIYMKIEYGLQRNPRKAIAIQGILQDFFKSIQILSFGYEEAQYAGRIRAELMNKGTPIGPYDLLIAATAMHHKLTVITSNISEFQRVDNLLYENWSTPK